MKISSLRVKIISGIIFFCFLIFSLIFYLMALYQKEAFFNMGKEQAFSASARLQSVFLQPKDIADKTKIQEVVYGIGSAYPNLTKIDISLMQDGKMTVIASLEFAKIGKESGLENYKVFQSGLSEKYEAFTSVFDKKEESFFKIIAPIKLSGAVYGTYEISAFPQSLYESFGFVWKKTMQTMALGLALLALVLFLFLDSLVLKPIKKLEQGISFFSRGKFDHKIDEKGTEEFSSLAKGLNDMSKELYKSYDSLEDAVRTRTEELEEARAVLEIKVAARTRQLQEMNNLLEAQVKEKTLELQGKIKDLEKFNKLMIDREIRMVELKNEIKKLKEEKK